MDDPTALPDIVRRLVDTALGADGDSSPALRRAVADRSAAFTGAPRDPGDIPDELTTLVDKVARNAYKVVDEDYDRLRDAGYSEDALYEFTVAAAVGASLGQFERGLEAMKRARARR
ncbi:MAG: hypothetical protein AAF799_09510 [Myxococcota bacterium]